MLQRTGLSEDDQIREAFANVPCGDRKPSQLLRYTRSRIEKQAVSEPVLRTLWMDRLPTTVTQIIAPLARGATLDELADSADQVFARMDQGINSVRTPTQNEPSTMEKALEELQKQMREIQLALRQRSRSPTPPRRQTRNINKRRTQEDDICWYHKNYGKDAKNCKPPCKHQGN